MKVNIKKNNTNERERGTHTQNVLTIDPKKYKGIILIMLDLKYNIIVYTHTHNTPTTTMTIIILTI